MRVERDLHFRWMTLGLRGLRDGDLGRLEVAQGRCLAGTALRGAAGTLAWLAVFAWAWLPLHRMLPVRADAALAMLPLWSPAVAVGTLAELYGSRSGLRWLGAGALGAALLVLVLEGGG